MMIIVTALHGRSFFLLDYFYYKCYNKSRTYILFTALGGVYHVYVSTYRAKRNG